MPVIAIVNRKGGSGKSTLATQLAGHLAQRGLGVMLGDMDRQQSTAPWLRRRAAHSTPAAAVVGWAVDPKNVLRPPAGVTHVVIDTPGALQGFELARVLMLADAVLIPLCNAAFDRESAAACLSEVRRHPRVASGRCKVATVGMRIDARTSGEQRLQRWAEDHDVPFIATLREAQVYVRCVEHGLTIFDLPASRVQTDLEQWQPILQWLAPLLETSTPADAAPAQPRRVPAPAAVPRTGVTTAQQGRSLALPEPGATGLRRWLGWLLPPRPQARL